MEKSGGGARARGGDESGVRAPHIYIYIEAPYIGPYIKAVYSGAGEIGEKEERVRGEGMRREESKLENGEAGRARRGEAL